MSENIYWSNNVQSYYSNAICKLKESDIRVFLLKEFYEGIALILKQYLTIGNNKVILIKTSVTGKRNINYEINNNLLDTILCIVGRICSKSKVILADGPAYTSFTLECCRLNWDVFSKRYDVSILDLNKDNFCPINDWPVSETWLNADKIINLCKAKTHRRFGVTLSIKNLLGILSGDVLGYPKLSYRHERAPKLLFELDTISPKRLNIIDGFCGIGGDGPMHGKPTKSDFIVIGTDSYSCDFQATIEMGFAPCVTLGMIHPFMDECDNSFFLNKDDLRNLRRTHVDYFPNIGNAWMYRSLNYSFEKQQEYYDILLRGVQKCWEGKK